MKAKHFLYLTFAFLLITGCSNDNDPQLPTTAELLINKWIVVKVEDMSTSPPTVTEAGPCGGKSYYTFTSNGTFFTEAFYVDTNTDSCLSNGIETGTYDLASDDEKIVLFKEIPPNTVTFNIVSLTSSELVISSAQAPEYIYHFIPETNL